MNTHHQKEKWSDLVMNMNIGYYPNHINDNLLMSLRLNDHKGIESNLTYIFGFIRERQLSSEFTYLIVMGLISLCLSYVIEIEKKVEDIFGQGFSPYYEMTNMQSLEDTYQWIYEIFNQIVVFSSQNKLSKSRKFLDSAREYIDLNYSNCNLNVEGIARKLYITSSYLRKIFKKELNVTVTSYITKVRMNYAKQFIREGRMNLTEISEKVGYSYSGYFSTSFKKFYGITPSEFENSSSRR